MVLSSTIVADNEASGDPDLGGGGGGYSYFQAGFNLIGERPYLATFTGDPSGSNIVGEEPNLGPLYDNGGPTYTHEPYGNSPALDAGIANGLTQDQRGDQRTIRLPGVRTARIGHDRHRLRRGRGLPGGGGNAGLQQAQAPWDEGEQAARVGEADGQGAVLGRAQAQEDGEREGPAQAGRGVGQGETVGEVEGKALKRLNKSGNANVQAKVRFAPDCGRARTKSKKIGLVKR